MQEKTFPKHANMVGIGFGIAGAGTALACARRGIKNMVWLDKGPLYHTGGSTTHTSGIVHGFSFSKLNTCMRDGSREIFQQLSAYGQCCFDDIGMWELASSQERMDDILRRYETALSWGRPRTELKTPRQIKEALPLIDETRLLGATYQPDGGLVDATFAVEIMAKEVEEMDAASIWGDTNVTEIDIQDGHVRGVVTSRGYIETENIVICAGAWGNGVAKLAGIDLPMWKVEHANVTLGPFSDSGEHQGRVRAIGRDQGLGVYFRTMLGEGDEWGDYSPDNSRRMYDPNMRLDPKHGALYFPTFDEFPVQDFSTTVSPAEREFTPSDMERYLLYPIERAKYLFPYTGDEPGVMHVTNGLIAVTPDENPIIGEWPGIKGLWLVERVWVAEAPGAGKVFADLFIDGACEWGETYEVSPARFFPHQLRKKYMLGRVWEYAGCVYSIMHPDVQFEEGRGIKKSPLYDIAKHEFDAEFWEAGGQERAMWHNSNNRLRNMYPSVVDRPADSWEAQQFSTAVSIEALHTSKFVSVTDLSSFGKIKVKSRSKGSGAARDFLDYIAVARMPESGRAVYTPLLNKFGGIKSDVIIQHLSEDEFMFVTGAAAVMEDLRWLQRHLPTDGSVSLANVTDRYAVEAVWGPHARRVLEKVTSDDVSNDAFRYMDTREITVSGVQVQALRVGFVGELGWELSIPRFEGTSKNDENARKVYRALMGAGEEYQIIPMGLYPYRGSLRIRKNYPLLGPQSDVNTEHNLLGAGIIKGKYTHGDDFSRVKEMSFVGKRAVLAKRDQTQPPEEITCLIEMRSPEFIPGSGAWPIFDPDKGKLIQYSINGIARSSYTTSLSIADTLSESEGKQIVLAKTYLPPKYAEVGTDLEMLCHGKKLPAKVAIVGNGPLHDPENTFMKI